MSKGPYREIVVLEPISAAEKIHERIRRFHNSHEILLKRVKQTRKWLISSLKANNFEFGEHDSGAPAADVFLRIEGLDRLWMEFQIPDKTKAVAHFKLGFTPVAQCEGYEWTTLDGRLYTVEMFYEDVLKIVEKKTRTSLESEED